MYNKKIINDKNIIFMRIIGIIVLFFEYLRDNRSFRSLEKDEVLNKPNLFETALKDKGVCVVKNFVDKETSLHLKNSLLKTIETCLKKTLKNNFYEEKKFLIQKGPIKLKTYKELQSYPKTVFHIRDTEEDKGFIDIFNVDLLFKNEIFLHQILNSFDSIKIEKGLEKIIGKKIKRSGLNVYITPQLEKTRCLHIDSLNKDAKVFIYLSDVSNINKGPYGYVLGSHKYKLVYYLWMKLYKILPKLLVKNLKITDAVMYKTKDAHFFIGKPGTLICSLQNGAHRGFPQTSKNSRMVLVAHYE